MIKGVVMLFKEKGFYWIIIREIVKVVGFSIGMFYEYI